MAIYKQIFPTRYPLLDFHLAIWRFQISTNIMRQSPESMTYEYIRVGLFWNKDMFFHFRLFDTQQRILERIDGMLQDRMTNIEAILTNYDRIFKGTTMWKEQRSFLKQSLTSFEKEIREKTIDQVCTGVLVGVCISFWVESQKWQGNYDRCIEVVKMYKNYVER